MTIESENQTSFDEEAVAESAVITEQTQHESLISRAGHFVQDIGKIAVSGQGVAALTEAFRAARF